MDSDPPGMKVLVSYGFTDPATNRRALAKAGGRVALAVEYIVNNDLDDVHEDRPLAEIYARRPSGQPPAAPPAEPAAYTGPLYVFPVLALKEQEAVLALAGLGFTDEGKIRHALHRAGWKVDAAASLLLEQFDSLDSTYSGTPIGGVPSYAPPAGPPPPQSLPGRPYASSSSSASPSASSPALPFRGTTASAAFVGMGSAEAGLLPPMYGSGRSAVSQPIPSASSLHGNGNGNGNGNGSGRNSTSSDPYAALRAVSPSNASSWNSAHNPFAAAAGSAPVPAPTGASGYGGLGVPARSTLSTSPQLPKRPEYATSTASSTRYSAGQKKVLAEFDPFSDDHRI
ncbi:hypothetical protein BC831DRAFT_452432 [Entophlyctis helioformis]|nr:hypothetical protein BC831DRAFT_452432 [Entophlyctis helioformis]